MSWLDKTSEKAARRLANGTSRRSFLSAISKIVIGGAVAGPLLPYDRTSAHAQEPGHTPNLTGNDPQSCDYWRYCAAEGFMCACCGGTASLCPPGTTPSAIAWVGTCLNPNDGKQYLISYNDCCGKGSCGRCFCAANQDERPSYRPSVSNSMNWCMADDGNEVFNCTIAVVVGEA